MIELGWVTVNGKRVLPVNAHPGRCSTSSELKTLVKPPHLVCSLWSNCGRECQKIERRGTTMFISEEQLPAYLALRLEGLAP
jgi:hypothetical protein